MNQSKLTSTTIRPEVLAPGGSMEAVVAAMENGADAVYVGVGSLNARRRASNLSLVELPAAVNYVHQQGGKLYVALNVPLQEPAVGEAVETLAHVWMSGADAVILRDPLLMEWSRTHCPGLEVHASTQAGVHDVASATRFQKLGCSRVVLARECSLHQIAEIHRALPELELESFFFGAMCFGVSGQCLLGEAVGGRSGNYGACLQACRLPYVTSTGEPLGHVLSMKDLDYFRRIKELVQAGVVALKIEGRLKSPAWVGCVSDWAKTASRQWERGGLAASQYDSFNREVGILFSRPRTDAFLDNVRDAAVLIDTGAPGHRGFSVPFVSRLRGKSILIEFTTPVPLSIRDGLMLTRRGTKGEMRLEPLSIPRFFDPRGKERKVVDAGERARVEIPGAAEVVEVAIHSCQALRQRYEGNSLSSARQALGKEQRGKAQSVSLQGTTLRLLVTLGRHTHECLREDVAWEPARTPGGTLDAWQRLFPDAELAVPEGSYVSPKVLKKIRREALEEAGLGRDAHLLQLLEEMNSAVAADPLTFLPPDDKLVREGAAALSMVVGLPVGEIRSSGGDRFVLEERNGATVVRWIPKESDI